MPKSRHRSRDARRRAQKKREKREKLARHLELTISRQPTPVDSSECPYYPLTKPQIEKG